MPLLDEISDPATLDEDSLINLNPVKAVPFAALTGGKPLFPGRGRLVGLSVFDTVGVETLAQTPAVNVGAAGAGATLTVNGTAGKRTTLTALSVSLSATVAAAPTVTVSDGAGVVQQWTLPNAAGLYTIPLPQNGIVITAGNNLVVASTAAGAASVVSLNIVTGGTVAEASFELFDGQDATGESLGVWVLPLGGSLNQVFSRVGPDLTRGIYINVLSGTIRGSVLIQPITT